MVPGYQDSEALTQSAGGLCPNAHQLNLIEDINEKLIQLNELQRGFKMQKMDVRVFKVAKAP